MKKLLKTSSNQRKEPMKVTIKRSELLKSKGIIEMVTPKMGSLPLDNELASILSGAIQSKIYKENQNDERTNESRN